MTDQGTEDGLTIDGVKILPGQWWRSRSPRLPFTVRIRDVVEDRIYYVTSPVPPEEGEESTIPSMMYADAFERNYQFDPLLDKALRRAEEAEAAREGRPDETSDEVWRIMKERFHRALAREWIKDDERRRA